MEKLLTK